MRNWWLSLSIQRKTLLFTTVIAMFAVMIAVFSIATLGGFLADFNVVLGESYGVNQVLIHLEQEQDAFWDYANYRQETQKLLYEEARSRSYRTLSGLTADYESLGADRYTLTQAIQTSYASYVEACKNALLLDRDSEAFIQEFYRASSIAAYIDGYIRDLMEKTLTAGNAQYYEKVERYAKFPHMVAALIALSLGFVFLFWRLISRFVVRPVLALAAAARRITANDYDIPAIAVSNRDELGELVDAFNLMSRSMSRHIASLQEKREIEQRLHHEEMQRVEAESSLQKLQVSLLQSQIHPHFLFNTLNIISKMAKLERAPDTEELILRLSNLFRYNLQTASETVTLTRELQIIKDYMYIQYRRFGMRVRLEVDCRVDADRVRIPTFTLQPIVENAVIHGISPRESGGRIRVTILQKERCVWIAITDNGVGMTPARREQFLCEAVTQGGHLSGIGIGNVRTRLESLYPNSRFGMHSRPGRGTSVRMTIPLEHTGLREPV